ncbi:MAG: hypothetical protein ACREIF_04390 [Chthoniobacterales bacterium]
MKKTEQSQSTQSAPQHGADSCIDPLLPDPMDLAKLAAILEPRLSPGHRMRPEPGLQTAMEFYLEAVLVCRALASSLETEKASGRDELAWLVDNYGSNEQKKERLRREFDEGRYRERERDALRLEPKKEWDEVRQFLDEEAKSIGLELTKSGHYLVRVRTVLDHIRKWHKSLPKRDFRAKFPTSTKQFMKEHKRRENGVNIYKFSKSLLVEIVRFDKAGRKKSKDKSWKTRRAKAAQEKTLDKIRV